MTAYGIAFYVQFYGPLVGLELLDIFFDALKNILTYTKTFKWKYSFRSTELKTEDNGAYFSAYNFLQRPNVANCKRPNCSAEIMLQSPITTMLVNYEASDGLNAYYFVNRTLIY